ncbi:MAG: hypothetical protein WCT77_14950, partial [Bacteroidota bacterium]
MKKILLVLCIFLIAISVFPQTPSVKFYLRDRSFKEYKIEDIKNLTFILSDQSYSMTIFQKMSIKTNIDIKEIDSILFDGNQIMKIVQSGQSKIYDIKNIDSILFNINTEKPD